MGRLLCAILCVSTLTVAVTELGLRLAGAVPRGFSRFSRAMCTDLLVSHPTRGFAYRPGSRCDRSAGGRVISIEINASGFRDRPGPLESDHRPILALGDSFTAGWGVQSEEAWPSQLESMLTEGASEQRPVRVLNRAVSGYSLRQIRITLDEVLEEIEPELVIVAAFVGGLYRLADPYVLHHGHLVAKGVVPRVIALDAGFLRTPFDDPFMRSVDGWLGEHFLLGSHALRAIPGVLREPAAAGPPRSPSGIELRTRYEPFLEELKRMHRRTRERGAEFVVLLVNSQEADGTYLDVESSRNRIIVDDCDENQILALDLLPILEQRSGGKPIFRLPADIHWSAAANTIAAEELYRFVGEHGWLQN